MAAAPALSSNNYVLFSEKGRLSTRRSRGRVTNRVTFSSTTSYVLLEDLVGFFPIEEDLVTDVVGNSIDQDAVSTLWQARLVNGTSFIVGNSFIRNFSENGGAGQAVSGGYLSEIDLYQLSNESDTGLALVHTRPAYLMSHSIKSIDGVELAVVNQQVRGSYSRIRLINGAAYIVSTDSLGTIKAVNLGREASRL